MAKGLVPLPPGHKIDFSPSPKQYELWKLLQPNYCPHCGGEIEQAKIGADYRGDAQYKPKCKNCGTFNLPQIILGGGAAGKRPHLPALTAMC